jgi:UMF1 family MFS transporter
MGPLLFSLVVSRTGSYRLALLSLIFFFVVGLIVLWLTDTDRAIRESQKLATDDTDLKSGF